MATSKITFIASNGNLFTALSGEDHISGIAFDVATYPSSSSNTGANGDVYEFFSLKEAEDFGFKPFDAEVSGNNYEGGVPHYHISEFFRINPNGQLFVGVKDMTTDGDFAFLNDIQKAAQGKIRQMGVYTKQNLFTDGATALDPYTLNLVSDLQAAVEIDVANNKPYVAILSANLTNVEGDLTDLTRFPEIFGDTDKVSVLLGQGDSETIQFMQAGNGTKKATVGCVGSALGCVSIASVHESIAWVSKFNIGGGDMDKVAFGFGDTTDIAVNDERLSDNTPFDALTSTQLDSIENKGYVFPIKYTGYNGTYFSSDRTASIGDYRTIARNRAIDKSRRIVRTALLPTMNSPVYLNPTTGKLSSGSISRFKSLVDQQLSVMRKALEVSGYSITIDPDQDILATDKLTIRYRIVPVGVAKEIEVEIGFAPSVNQ